MQLSYMFLWLAIAMPLFYLGSVNPALAQGETHASISSHLNYLYFGDGSARFNPDGSFYRGDEFSITVSYSLAADVVSHSLTWRYDKSVFIVLKSDGSQIFKILPGAGHGIHAVTAQLHYVWRYYTSESYACGFYRNETCWRQVPHDVDESVSSSQTIEIVPHPPVILDSSIVNVRDTWGAWRNNSDGTYYRGDGFKTSFGSSQVGRNVAYFTVEPHLDLKAFERVDRNKDRFDFNPDSNRLNEYEGSFEYNTTSTANPQTYHIQLKAYGYDSSGNLLTTGSSSLSVTVAEYDPRFSNPLTYPFYKGRGSTAYEKPFVVLVKYLGNGPTYNVRQRAVIDSYLYEVNIINFTYAKDKCLKSNYTDCYDTAYIRQPLALVNWFNKTQRPIVMQGEDNYARLIFNMSSVSVREILSQNHTFIRIEVSLYTNMFFENMKPLLQSTYIYTPYSYTQPVEVLAVRPKDRGWAVDTGVHIALEVKAVGEKTFKDALNDWAQSQTEDIEALRLFSQDLYSNDLQRASGIGALNLNVNRTAILSYHATITATGYGKSRTVTSVFTPPFTNESIKIFVNMMGGGLAITDAVDHPYAVKFYLKIANESGGVKWIAFVDDQGVVVQNKTLPEIQNPSLIRQGYTGSLELVYMKSFNDLSRINLQYGNAWGAVSTIRNVSIQPYEREDLKVPLRLDQLAFGLGILLVLAMAVGFTGLQRRT